MNVVPERTWAPRGADGTECASATMRQIGWRPRRREHSCCRAGAWSAAPHPAVDSSIRQSRRLVAWQGAPMLWFSGIRRWTPPIRDPHVIDTIVKNIDVTDIFVASIQTPPRSEAKSFRFWRDRLSEKWTWIC